MRNICRRDFLKMAALCPLLRPVRPGRATKQEETGIYVDKSKCTGCGDCAEEDCCPVEAITMKDGVAHVDNEECIECGACIDVCPVAALKPMSEAPKKKTQEGETEKKEQEQEGGEDFDIRGSWVITGRWKNEPDSWSYVIHFVGDRGEGRFRVEEEAQPAGSYTVSGRKARWVFMNGDVLAGEFTDRNHMKGSIGEGLGSWTAVRK